MTETVCTQLGSDGIRRCWWCGSDPLYQQYHDLEWGRPVLDDYRLFEKICLEGFQSGLSWLTILRKREAFRRAFCEFDFQQVARYTQRNVQRLLADAAIVRHRGKIESTINNARRAVEMADEHGGLSHFFWQFKPSRVRVLRRRSQLVPMTDESKALSKQLKHLGWTFVGPTTCYAFMQAVGLVNDHFQHCASWRQVQNTQDQRLSPSRCVK